MSAPIAKWTCRLSTVSNVTDALTAFGKAIRTNDNE
jgi:hypothetical protein